MPNLIFNQKQAVVKFLWRWAKWKWTILSPPKDSLWMLIPYFLTTADNKSSMITTKLMKKLRKCLRKNKSNRKVLFFHSSCSHKEQPPSLIARLNYQDIQNHQRDLVKVKFQILETFSWKRRIPFNFLSKTISLQTLFKAECSRFRAQNHSKWPMLLKSFWITRLSLQPNLFWRTLKIKLRLV